MSPPTPPSSSSSSSSSSSDAATAAAAASRIITHMDTDHQREMALYLRHHARLPATHPDVVLLTQLSLAEITPAGMTILAGGSGTTYTVPFSPPLDDSLAETRPRLVQMAEEARAALGLPQSSSDYENKHVRVTEFIPPPLYNMTMMGIMLLYAASVAAVPYMLLPEDTLLGRALDVVWAFGGGRAGYRWFIVNTMWPVLAIHVTEAAVFHFTSMKRHGVRAGSKVWWLWQMDVFVEGVFGMRRFGRMVDELEKKAR
jgi:hypothetical protein